MSNQPQSLKHSRGGLTLKSNQQAQGVEMITIILSFPVCQHTQQPQKQTLSLWFLCLCRTVDTEDKSFAVGVQYMLFRVLGESLVPLSSLNTSSSYYATSRSFCDGSLHHHCWPTFCTVPECLIHASFKLWYRAGSSQCRDTRVVFALYVQRWSFHWCFCQPLSSSVNFICILDGTNVNIYCNLPSHLHVMCLCAAFMPGPVLYGSVIDTTCILWGEKCGKQTSCLYYNLDHFRQRWDTLRRVQLYLPTLH